jgi:hypothetical protein
MPASWNKKNLKVFIRNTLGCGCPERVFEKIDVSDLQTGEREKKITRVVVGDVLLIYVMQRESSGNLVDSVESIGLAGKTDRDTNNYNRFRLVVSGFEDVAQQKEISERFSKSFSTDEKMHIHFVNKELIDGLN